eukprot:Opistho-1_new@90422
MSVALIRRSTCKRYSDPLEVPDAVSSGCGTGGCGMTTFAFFAAAARSASATASAYSFSLADSSSHTSIASISNSPDLSVSAVRFVAAPTSASAPACESPAPSFARSASNCSSRSRSRSSSGNSISSERSHTRMERSCDPVATKSPELATARHHAPVVSRLERGHVLERVAVPVLDEAVLGRGEKVVRVVHKPHCHNALLVRKDTLVTVAKIEAPQLDVLVRGRRHQQRAVRTDVHRRHGQLVPVHRQEKLERVVEEHLHRAVQQRHAHQATVGRVRDAQHVVLHLQRARVREAQSLPALRAAASANELKVPEAHFLVRGPRHEAPVVRTHCKRPYRALVRLHLLQERPCGEVKQLEVARLGPDECVAVAGEKRRAEAVTARDRAHARRRLSVPHLDFVVRRRENERVVAAYRNGPHIRAVSGRLHGGDQLRLARLPRQRQSVDLQPVVVQRHGDSQRRTLPVRTRGCARVVLLSLCHDCGHKVHRAHLCRSSQRVHVRYLEGRRALGGLFRGGVRVAPHVLCVD